MRKLDDTEHDQKIFPVSLFPQSRSHFLEHEVFKSFIFLHFMQYEGKKCPALLVIFYLIFRSTKNYNIKKKSYFLDNLIADFSGYTFIQQFTHLRLKIVLMKEKKNS